MPSFGNDLHLESGDRGEIRGRQMEVACKAWFTSTGSVRPLSFKFEGEDQMIHTVENLQVCSAEDCRYCGIPSVEYICHALIGGLSHEFKLIFFKEDCRWVMVAPG